MKFAFLLQLQDPFFTACWILVHCLEPYKSGTACVALRKVKSIICQISDGAPQSDYHNGTNGWKQQFCSAVLCSENSPLIKYMISEFNILSFFISGAGINQPAFGLRGAFTRSSLKKSNEFYCFKYTFFNLDCKTPGLRFAAALSCPPVSFPVWSWLRYRPFQVYQTF